MPPGPVDRRGRAVRATAVRATVPGSRNRHVLWFATCTGVDASRSTTDHVNFASSRFAAALYAVVPAISVVPMAKDVPFESAALIGCGVTTGVGAAVKTAAVRPGSTVAVWGCGGVGLSRG